MLGGFGVLGVLLWWAGRSADTGWGWSGTTAQAIAAALWVIGALITALCLCAPRRARLVYISWMGAAMWLGSVMTLVLFTVLYFLFLPLFALVRLKDPLRLKLSRGDSYWQDHPPHEATLNRMKRLF